MLSIISKTGSGFLPHDPAVRGYHAVYRSDEVNHCSGCGRSHWLVGRLLAECGFCGTALPLLDGGMQGTGVFRTNTRFNAEETLLAG